MSDSVFEGFSQSAICEQGNGRFGNNKHVSFAQKQALLNFMIEHKQLAMRDNNDENLWQELTHLLNNVPLGAIRSAETWKKTWKLWIANVLKKPNDLSLTLLELQLQSFLESVAKADKLKATAEAFVNNENSLDSEQLCSIVQEFPQMLQDDILKNLVQKLKAIESDETKNESLINACTNRLSELINLKEELEKEYDNIINNLGKTENLVLVLKNAKIDVLGKIRNHLNLHSI